MRRLLELSFARLADERREAHPPPKKKPRTAGSTLAGPQAPEPPRVATLDEDAPAAPDSAWGIQVGAFKSFAAAQARATAAAGAARELLTGLAVNIVSTEGRDEPLFRARLTGLDETDAKAACAHLRGRDFECLPVPPKTPLAQGDR